MAIYKLRKLFSHVSADRPENYLEELSQRFSSFNEPLKNRFISPTVGAIIGAGVLSGIIALIYNFFTRKDNKYKASPDEIKAIQEELPVEYESMRNIQNEVIKSCRYIFSSRDAVNFYCNVLPSFLNINGEEWIAGWARETGKEGIRWAPILCMYKASFNFCYDFDNKYWFLVIDGKEYSPKDGNIWLVFQDEFIRVKGLAEKNLMDYPDMLRQVNLYLDTNLKLIKKYMKIKLKRKTFAFLGIGNVAKNWNNAEKLWDAGNKGKSYSEWC